MKAIWKNQLLAESEDTIVVEKNHYFPPESLKPDFFRPSSTRTQCPWKGEAAYYDIKVGQSSNPDAAWYYPHPKPAAEEIKDYVAFWNGIKIEE